MVLPVETSSIAQRKIAGHSVISLSTSRGSGFCGRCSNGTMLIRHLELARREREARLEALSA
jgi:hypothetical protein